MTVTADAPPTLIDGTEYELVVGLEVHTELATATKLFSASPNRFGDEPNTNIDPVTLGLPGSSLRHAIEVVLFGAVLFTVWAGVFPRAAAVVLTILVAIGGFGGPLVALAQRDAWRLVSVLFDFVAFFLARRAVPVATPYKRARRRARQVRRDVRMHAGGGM